MTGKLDPYRRKRRFDATPEPEVAHGRQRARADANVHESLSGGRRDRHARPARRLLRDRYGMRCAATPTEAFMSSRLEHCKVAILAVDGFEEAERVEPRRTLAAEGAQVDVISRERDEIQEFRHVDKGARARA
nr:hypothetical protein [Burkholderia sp. BCC1977]